MCQTAKKIKKKNPPQNGKKILGPSFNLEKDKILNLGKTFYVFDEFSGLMNFLLYFSLFLFA